MFSFKFLLISAIKRYHDIIWQIYHCSKYTIRFYKSGNHFAMIIAGFVSFLC